MRFFSVLWLAAAASAQTRDIRPSFEAASVKLNSTGTNNSSSHGSERQVNIVNNSLHRLVERAYNVKAFQVAGPKWMDDVRFDVIAKYPEGTKNEDRPAMMRTLLEDRFKLAVHTETRDLPGYVLVVLKRGLKIKPVEKTEGDDSTHSSNGLVKVEVVSVSMKQVADLLGRRLNSTVIDRTGADGFYSFKIQWTLDPSTSGPVDRSADEFAAIQDAIAPLGLRLKAQKVPVQVIVVDHLEKTPTEN